jgi:hypothetical protein
LRPRAVANLEELIVTHERGEDPTGNPDPQARPALAVSG